MDVFFKAHLDAETLQFLKLINYSNTIKRKTEKSKSFKKVFWGVFVCKLYANKKESQDLTLATLSFSVAKGGLEPPTS